MPEVIQDEISGYVTPQRNFETLADRICVLLEDDRLRTRLGATGRSIVEQHYTAKIMTDKHLSVYDEVLSGRSTSASLVSGQGKAAAAALEQASVGSLLDDATQPAP